MEIEIEQTLVINLFLNFLILKLTSIMLRKNLKLIFISIIIPSIVAIIYPLFNLGLWKIFITILTAIFMTCISFDNKDIKGYLVTIATIFMTTFLFGGACYAVQCYFGQFPLFVVAIIGFLIFLISKSILIYQKRKNIIENFTYDVVFKDGDIIITEKAFLDSGNMLYDNITKKPIVLINYDIFAKFYSNISYIKAWTKATSGYNIKNGHYVKINGIGSGSSILVFMIDELKVGQEKTFKNVMVGLSFAGFEKRFGWKVLLHNELV